MIFTLRGLPRSIFDWVFRYMIAGCVQFDVFRCPKLQIVQLILNLINDRGKSIFFEFLKIPKKIKNFKKKKIHAKFANFLDRCDMKEIENGQVWIHLILYILTIYHFLTKPLDQKFLSKYWFLLYMLTFARTVLWKLFYDIHEYFQYNLRNTFCATIYPANFEKNFLQYLSYQCFEFFFLGSIVICAFKGFLWIKNVIVVDKPWLNNNPKT